MHRLEQSTCKSCSSNVILVRVTAVMSRAQSTYECLCVKLIKGTLFIHFSQFTLVLMCLQIHQRGQNTSLERGHFKLQVLFALFPVTLWIKIVGPTRYLNN